MLNKHLDMQATMEQTQAFENRVLERLNAGKTVRNFLITAVWLFFYEAVNLLVLQVFAQRPLRGEVCWKNRYDGDGPLGICAFKTHLRVGVINRQEYARCGAADGIA